MSINVSALVWERSRATGSARLVLLALADHAGDDGRAWPSVSRLARMTLLDRRNVQRALARLIEAGEIVVVGTAQRGVSIYRITPGSTARPAAEAPQRRRRRSGAGDARPAAPMTRTCGGSAAQTTMEPSIEPSVSSSSEISAAVDLWNKLCDDTGLKPVTRLTASRRKLLAARFAECGGYDGWACALLKISQTPGLLGAAASGWRIDFDWLLSETHFTKLTEGRYDHWDPAHRPAQKPSAAADRQSRALAGLAAAVEAREARRRRKG